jgi:small GTP-binding protein
LPPTSRADGSFVTKIPTFKVITLGDPSVGKTSILTQFQQSKFFADQPSTVGAYFFTKRIDSQVGPIHLNLWDTAGHEQYRCLLPMYSRDCAAAIVVFDLSELDTLDNLDAWVDQLRTGSPSALLFVVGNKIDLLTEAQLREAKIVVRKTGMHCYYVSALSGAGIQQLFEEIATAVASKQLDLVDNVGISLKEKPRPEGCC